MDQAIDIQEKFKLAMRRLTSTISLITTHHNGRNYGMAATAVQSVCADPTVMLVCINRSASICAPLGESKRFAINILHKNHQDLVPIFSGKLKDEARFEYGAWRNDHGTPVLSDAQASMVCDVINSTSMGTHEVVFGQVVSVSIRDEISPLLYENGELVASRPLTRSADV